MCRSFGLPIAFKPLSVRSNVRFGASKVSLSTAQIWPIPAGQRTGAFDPKRFFTSPLRSAFTENNQ
jgi:hypothetical protein